MSQRKRLAFTPTWEGSIEGWTVNYIHKNLWRVPRYLEFGDLINDAYIRFLDCIDRYPHVVDAPHFMSLYKVCVLNHITDLSHKGTKMRQEIIASSLEVDGSSVDSFIPAYGVVDDSADQFLIAESLAGEPEMAAVISGFSKPTRPKFRRDKKTKKREMTSEYICRVAEIPYRKTIGAEVRDFLTGDDCV